MSLHSRHPRPILDLLTQGAALLFLATSVALVVIQLVLIVRGVSPLLVFAVVTTLLLLAIPALWLLFATPALTLDEDALTLRPLAWQAVRVPWSEVRAVKRYPLLPEKDGERVRQAFVGRANFRPAEGIMLIIPSLPAQYRVHGALAGEGWVGVVAVTSRTHSDYDAVRDALQERLAEVWT